MPVPFGTVPAGSFVRVKSRFRLYSASARDLPAADFGDVDDFAVDRLADDLSAVDLFEVALFDADRFAVAFRAPPWLVDGFVALFFAVVFFVTGGFTVRLRVVAMMAPRCEDCAGSSDGGMVRW